MEGCEYHGDQKHKPMRMVWPAGRFGVCPCGVTFKKEGVVWEIVLMEGRLYDPHDLKYGKRAVS